MSQDISTQMRGSEVAPWNSLYKIGGIVALIFIVYSLVTMAVLVAIGGPPETAVEVFDLLENQRVVGLLRLDILTMLTVPLYYPLFLSTYAALRKTQRAYVTLATTIAFAGITLFLATPSPLSLVALSDKFAAATTEAQHTQLLAAGEAILAADMWHGTGAMIGGLLMLIAALILSIVMLGSDCFSKGTAYVGIVTHALDLAHGIVGLFLPTVGVILMAIAGPLYLVWFPLLARDFFRLRREIPDQTYEL